MKVVDIAGVARDGNAVRETYQPLATLAAIISIPRAPTILMSVDDTYIPI